MSFQAEPRCMGLDAGAHSSYSLFYDLVWAPKYRRRVLEGRVGERVEQVIMEVSARYGYKVDTLKVSPDHIHLLISLPPPTSVAEAVRTLKSITVKDASGRVSRAKKTPLEGKPLDAGIRRQQRRQPKPRHSKTIHTTRTRTLTNRPKAPRLFLGDLYFIHRKVSKVI